MVLTTDEMVTGAYPWTVKQGFDKTRFSDLRAHDLWVREENQRFLQGYDHLIGEEVYISYGGHRLERDAVSRWRGVYQGLVGVADSYGVSARLQQPNRVKDVDGWQIIKIERVR